ncbi:MAG: response regulator [Saprospiraceae bacterium]
MKEKIQIAEHELIIANDISELLEENDYEVTEICSTYEEGIACFQKECPDLIISELILNRPHHYDGIKIIESIRKTSNMPIIYLTGYPKIKEAIATNPFAFLTKPINGQDLLDVIRLALNSNKT